MANSTGQSSSPIIKDLLQKGHEFSFPQVMRLVRKSLGMGNGDDLQEKTWQSRVRVRPDLSFAFPAADVAGIEQEDDHLLVTATFLALYGTSSPLPCFYTEDLLDEAAADSSVSRDFLDIFQQRLYDLYFQAWSKYRLFIRVSEEKNEQDRERLFCLIGLGEKDLRYSLPEAWWLVRYAGLLTQSPRSAVGLQTLLRDALGVHSLFVEQCILRKVLIPADQRMRMGISGMRLGMDTVLGSEVDDRMGKFRMVIGPLKKMEFDSFLPGTPQHDRLIALIRFYIVEPLDFDLKVELAAGEARPISLGDPAGPRLGWNTWCFSSYTLGAVSTVFRIADCRPKQAGAADDLDQPENSQAQALADYYKSELARLRDLVGLYVRKHPKMAFLVGGHTPDSGVERLLEGTAFLNACLQQKLDDDFPELIHNLTEALHPWDLRPIPATTIVAFTHKPQLKQPLLLPAGAEVASIPLQGTQCRFKTCFDVTVHPLTLLDASFIRPSGQAPSIRLHCELNSIGLSGWKTESLRLFLGDAYPAACDLYLLLMRYLKRIVISAFDTDAVIEISPDNLKPVGFGDGETILTKEKCFMPGHLILQEYFLFHDKFLFMDLTGFGGCKTLGSGKQFEIRFELTADLPVIPHVSPNSFVFSATPVINLFEHKARPVFISSGLLNQEILPAGEKSDHYQLYSVNRVEGMAKNRTAKIVYDLQNSSPQRKSSNCSCKISHAKSVLKDGFDTFISIPDHAADPQISRAKLDIDLTCTNGALPDQLGIGEICYSIRPTPEFVEPQNIKPVNPSIYQDSQSNRQWRLLAGFTLGHPSLVSVSSFRSILRLFVNSNSRDQIGVLANNKRIDGIVSIEAKQTDRLIARRMFRGYEIRLGVRGDHFSGPGDLYLFCSVLERFLCGYVTQNCFVRLDVEEVNNGHRFEWPARMGDRCVV